MLRVHLNYISRFCTAFIKFICLLGHHCCSIHAVAYRIILPSTSNIGKFPEFIFFVGVVSIHIKNNVQHNMGNNFLHNVKIHNKFILLKLDLLLCFNDVSHSFGTFIYSSKKFSYKKIWLHQYIFFQFWKEQKHLNF